MDSNNNDLQPSNNGQKSDNLHFERSEVKCKRCGKTFANMMIEEIDNLAQLRCGDVLIAKTEMVCLHCGWVFYWNIREKDLSRMAVTYGELVVEIRKYKPE